MMNRVLELLKKSWKVLRNNLGLKILSLVFALILWNYVIAEVDPLMNVKLHGVNIRLENESVLKQASLAIKGDKNFEPMDVTVRVHRSDVGLLKDSDVYLWVNLNAVTHDGEQELRIQSSSARGTVVGNLGTVKLTIERLSTKVVPVNVETTGTLPANYWNGKPEIKPDTLVITGAGTDIGQVERAVIAVSLDNLNSSIVTHPYDFTLLDANGATVELGNMTLSSPNCIVSLTVYPTKMVPVRAKDFSGKLSDGYEQTSVTLDPPQILVAGPAEALASLDVLDFPRIDLANASTNIYITRALDDLPRGVQAINNGSVAATVGVDMKTVTATLSNLPISISGLGSGLTVNGGLTASVKITCPELYYSRVTKQRVHLYLDVDGLAAGTYTLPVRAEIDPSVGSRLAVVTPLEYTVTINPIVTPAMSVGGP